MTDTNLNISFGGTTLPVKLSLAGGSVNSVAMTVPAGFAVSGSPITGDGTLALDFAAGYSLPTDAKQTNWDTAYGWGDHASAGYLTAETYTGTVTSVSATVPTGFTISGSPITSAGTLAFGFDTGYALPTTADVADGVTAYGWGNHASAGYLAAGDIGVSVEAYDATILKSADIGSTVQAHAAVLDNTTAGFTSAQETKLGYISVTQAVDLDQMETDIAALANGMVYKGDWDASAGSFPGAGAAQTGWLYYVSVDGTVDGVAFNAGDNIVAIADNASTSTYASNWSKQDQTDAVSNVVGLVGSISKSSLLSALNVEDGADVTDTTNVTAAGAVMDSECTDLTAVKALDQGVASTDSPTFAGATVSGASASRVASFDASKALTALSTATYPSLAELAYVKGVTSAIQTQLGAKAASGTNTDITTLNPTGGLQVGSPTGGAQGSGTINASGLYIDGVAVGSGSGDLVSTNNLSDVANAATALSNLGGAPSTAPTFATSVTISYGTASELLATDASKNVVSLDTATYPSLTELSYAKGVTSAIQTQINAKAPSTSPTFATSVTCSYLTASTILSADGSKNIVSLSTSTYPSLTELSYLKGVTSAVQSQLDGKADLPTVSTQTTTAYTAVIGDANTVVQMSNTGAMTFTIPPNSSVAFDTGTWIEIHQANSGTVTVAAGAGVTLKSRGSLVALAGQEAVAGIRKIATDTWRLTGDIA